MNISSNHLALLSFDSFFFALNRACLPASRLKNILSQTNINIDLSNLAPGIYWIKTGLESTPTKIIKH